MRKYSLVNLEEEKIYSIKWINEENGSQLWRRNISLIEMKYNKWQMKRERKAVIEMKWEYLEGYIEEDND